MKRNRCTRHRNFTITETAREHIAHVFEEGQYRFSDHFTGAEFSTIVVECKDCGLVQKYPRSGLPKWLRQACEEAGIEL